MPLSIFLLIPSNRKTNCQPYPSAVEALRWSIDIGKIVQSTSWRLEGGAQRGPRKEADPCLPTLAW